MGKYLEALKLLYGDDEKSCETLKARTDKTDKRASVSNVSSSSGRFSEISPENEQELIPFTDHEIAKHKIDQEIHKDDRSFVRQRLIGIYGAKRLELVDQYLKHFNEGSNSVKETHKKSNAARFKANTWLREHSIKSKVDRSES